LSAGDALHLGVYQRPRTVEARHIDELGHVNNAVWVRFIVELADAHAEAVGMGFLRTRELGGQWIVRRHEVDYLQSAVAGDELIEETWVESLRGARSVRGARFLNAKDGRVLVRARTTWAFVTVDGLRPRRVPPAVVGAFELCPGPQPEPAPQKH